MVSSLHRIDLSDYENRKAEIGAQLLQSGTKTGFFNIVGAFPPCSPTTSHVTGSQTNLKTLTKSLAVGHGLPQEQIDLAFSYGKDFFTSPDSVKAKSLWNPDYYLVSRDICVARMVCPVVLDHLQAIVLLMGSRYWLTNAFCTGLAGHL